METLRRLDSPLVRFIVVGGTGTILNLAITYALTDYVLGTAHYFTAFVFGTGANLIYNFTLYTIAVFKTRERHLTRFALFVLYSLLMTAFQLWVVRIITGLLGASFYLAVIAAVIASFALLNYLLLRISVFNARLSAVPLQPGSRPSGTEEEQATETLHT